MRPSYYKFTIDGKEYQVIDIIHEKDLTYDLGTALAYILRAGYKDKNTYKQDLEKACTHLQFQLTKMIKKKEGKICIIPHSIFTFENLSKYYNLPFKLKLIGYKIYDHVFLSQESLSESLLLLKEYIHDL